MHRSIQSMLVLWQVVEGSLHLQRRPPRIRSVSKHAGVTQVAGRVEVLVEAGGLIQVRAAAPG